MLYVLANLHMMPSDSGLGCDLVLVSRIEELLSRSGSAFVERVLTPCERSEYALRTEKNTQRGVLYVATRYAAKEALSKAMGCGVGSEFSFQDAAVLNNEVGMPYLQFSDRLGAWMHARQAVARVSISDEKTMVMAVVMIDKGKDFT